MKPEVLNGSAPAPAPETPEGKLPAVPEHWRSLEQLHNEPEYRRWVGKEGGDPLPPSSLSRRNFLGIMGAAFAMSGLVGCRRPLAKILPYTKMPEHLVPGVAQQYATAWDFRGAAQGFLVTAYEGRPTKIDGNPDHPMNRGAADVFAQGALITLYDPDRSQQVLDGDNASSWSAFADWARPHFQGLKGNGSGLRFLSGPASSPHLLALRAEAAAAFPGAVWHTYEPLHRDAVLAGARLAFGRPLRTQIDFGQADVILSLDSDFLVADAASVAQARGFAARRRVKEENDPMNRLYVVENGFTITGAMADHRLRLACTQIADFGAALAARLGRGGAATGLEGMREPGSLGPDADRWLDAVAKDLLANQGRAVVVAGDRQPAELHALVHVINRALGAVGPVVRYTQEVVPENQTGSLAELAEALGAGSVDTLVVLGANPAYDAPFDLDLAARITRARNVVHLGLHRDETAHAARWHLPAAHFLEAWGDARAWDGTVSLQQPLIAPLYEGRSEAEVLGLLLTGEDVDGHAQLQDAYRKSWGMAGFETRWNRGLNDGVLPGTEFPEAPVTPDAGAVARAWSGRAVVSAPTRDALEIAFYADTKVFDGRFANSPWMQELPDPMTKLVWDNVALMSPRTARDLGVKSEDLVHVEADGRELTIPAFLLPGHADYSISIAVGYGRTHAGRVGDGVGVNAYTLRSSRSPAAVTGGSLAATGETYRLATTQNHDTMEGRPPFREADLDHYREHPEFAAEAEESPPLVNLYFDREYQLTEGYQWGLSVDLNTCTGCNACVTACQAENNIANVGKHEVIRGREMHWIRLDRYYVGSEDDPQAVQQPVPCQQCENAPCEAVCPVNATAHSNEGLNDMTYNRCIGTRYCSNNCPYKVRRFNFFDWNKHMTEVEKMAKNPNVTVRMRGVMEKCTYCVQRISRARIDAKLKGEPIADGAIRTACQETCPTDSIVFGNIGDPESRVSRTKAQNRNYQMLKFLNTKPRTSYLARIRNPNPELEHA